MCQTYLEANDYPEVREQRRKKRQRIHRLGRKLRTEHRNYRRYLRSKFCSDYYYTIKLSVAVLTAGSGGFCRRFRRRCWSVPGSCAVALTVSARLPLAQHRIRNASARGRRSRTFQGSSLSSFSLHSASCASRAVSTPYNTVVAPACLWHQQLVNKNSAMLKFVPEAFDFLIGCSC